MNRARLLFLILSLVSVPACAQNPQPPAPPAAVAPPGDLPMPDFKPAEKPVPPLNLAVPAALPATVDDHDLKDMDADELLGRAMRAMQKEEYAEAAAYQYWYVQKSKTGQYNLACFLARIGKTDAAFYWLQRAGLEEGVDTQHAQRDEDLESLHADPRWKTVHRYLQACNQYFESAHISRTVLVLPKKYKKSQAIPAVVWLHGLGSRPEDYVNDDLQDQADELNIAFIGVSGTKARGPRSFVWDEEPVENWTRVKEALEEVKDRLTVKPGQLIALGFSQGAQVGVEVAVLRPQEFAGAIALSPGARFHLDELEMAPVLAHRGFVVSCGAKELPGNVQLAKNDAGWLNRARAKVIHKPYPGVSAHAFPKDFSERFPEWIKFILEAGKE